MRLWASRRKCRDGSPVKSKICFRLSINRSGTAVDYCLRRWGRARRIQNRFIMADLPYLCVKYTRNTIVFLCYLPWHKSNQLIINCKASEIIGVKMKFGIWGRSFTGVKQERKCQNSLKYWISDDFGFALLCLISAELFFFRKVLYEFFFRLQRGC